MLEIDNIDVHYGDFQALFGLSLDVSDGKIVTIGANGAGKTTTLRAVAGIRPATQNVFGAPSSSGADRLKGG